MQIFDDYLGADALAALCRGVQAPDFPWGTTRVLGGAPGEHLAPEDNRQQVHGFYLDRGGIRHESHYLPLLRPLLRKLDAQQLLRIKLNRTPRHVRHVEYGLHVDIRRPGATTAIFYLNTNNGYTLFENGLRVDSVANRLVLFDTRIRHTGASCTDTDWRLVLNINMLLPPGRRPG